MTTENRRQKTPSGDTKSTSKLIPDLYEIAEVVILHNEVLAALPKNLAVGLVAFRLTAGAAVLEPDLNLPRLHAELHR